MARGAQGKGAGKAQMAQPPVTKYRKNIGDHQRDTTKKSAKRDFRDKADARKDRTKEGMLTSVFIYLSGLMTVLLVLYAILFYTLREKA